MTPIPGARTVKIRPDASHLGPNSTRIRSLPIKVRPTPNPMPAKARVEKAPRKYRPCCMGSRVTRLKDDTATAVSGDESSAGSMNRSYAFLYNPRSSGPKRHPIRSLSVFRQTKPAVKHPKVFIAKRTIELVPTPRRGRPGTHRHSVQAPV